MDTNTLYNILDRRFNLSDLHNLCFDCRWDVESIGTNHSIKPTFLRELIRYAQRHSDLEKLMALAAKRNRILVFDGKTLSERGGDEFTVNYEPDKPEPADPRITQKLAIIQDLQERNPSAVFKALIYLMEQK